MAFISETFILDQSENRTRHYTADQWPRSLRIQAAYPGVCPSLTYTPVQRTSPRGVQLAILFVQPFLAVHEHDKAKNTIYMFPILLSERTALRRQFRLQYLFGFIYRYDRINFIPPVSVLQNGTFDSFYRGYVRMYVHNIDIKNNTCNT